MRMRSSISTHLGVNMLLGGDGYVLHCYALPAGALKYCNALLINSSRPLASPRTARKARLMAAAFINPMQARPRPHRVRGRPPRAGGFESTAKSAIRFAQLKDDLLGGFCADAGHARQRTNIAAMNAAGEFIIAQGR